MPPISAVGECSNFQEDRNLGQDGANGKEAGITWVFALLPGHVYEEGRVLVGCETMNDMVDIRISENPLLLGDVDQRLDEFDSPFIQRLPGRPFADPWSDRLYREDVGTLNHGYIRKVPLPRVPQIQSASHATDSWVELGTRDTSYSGYIPVPMWGDLAKLLAGLGRSILPFSPVRLMSIAH